MAERHPPDGDSTASLPAYQARLLERGGRSPSLTSMSRSGSAQRHNTLLSSPTKSGSQFGSVNGTSSPPPPSSPFGHGGRFATSAGARGHTSGARSVDITRGFWQEREKTAAAASTTTDDREPASLRIDPRTPPSPALAASQDPLSGKPLPSSADMATSESVSSFQSSDASTSGPTWTPPVDAQPSFDVAPPPPSMRSASPSPSMTSVTSASHTPRRMTHRRNNSAAPTFKYQPSASSTTLSGSPSTSSFALRAATAATTAPPMERARTFDSPPPTTAQTPTPTPPPSSFVASPISAAPASPSAAASLSRASSITSRFAAGGTRPRPHSFHQGTMSASSLTFPSSAGEPAPADDAPVFQSAYMRERQKRLSQTSDGGGAGVSSPLALSPDKPSAPTLPDLGRPSSRSSIRSTSSVLSATQASAGSPSSNTAPSAVPSIKEPPLGARRGPAARLGRHMPRIASGDGQMDDDAPLASAAPARSGGLFSQSLGPSAGSRWGEGVRSVGEGDEVVGMKGRRRLPLASSSALGAPGSSSSSSAAAASAGVRLSTFAIERTRKEIIAEEYLTHVGEALQWVEGVLQEDLGLGVVEFEDRLRDGVVLAKIAQALGGLRKGERIFEHPKLQWRHSDNIILFLNFTQSDLVGLPRNFVFETIDLYEKKNLPKVIFCIHSLSHVLANRGLVEKIGNLAGKLNFTDEQLQAASKGLSGQAMPNFKSIGKDLAKEMNIEPPPETDDERRDRLLHDAEPSIRSLQAQATGYLARLDYRDFVDEVRAASASTSGLQAHARGALARVAYSKAAAARQDKITPVVAHISSFQSVARGALARNTRAHERRSIKASSSAVTELQAHARGLLSRHRFDAHQDELYLREEVFGLFAARAQGALARRRHQAKSSALTEVTVYQGLVRFGALARSAITRREVAKVKADFNVVAPALIGFQARAKAQLVRRNHQQLSAALANVSTISSALKSQSIFRAALSRARKGEQKKEVDFVLPNFVGFQAAARRAYQKGEYEWWSDHIRSHAFVAVRLQQLLRGAMVRRAFYGRLSHFYRNMEAVVRLQAIRRGKGPREGFNGIRLGKNVKVSTIKNFGHLLDDNNAEAKDEALLGTLRQQVVAVFRESQALEADAEELDQSIGLFAQNIAQFQGRTRTSTDVRPSSSFVDPFNASSLDRAAQHRLDLYQQLFYLLQTRADLLGKLCARLSAEVSDPSRKLVEAVVLALFGYGQGKREEYWAMMFFQSAVSHQIEAAGRFEDLFDPYFSFAKIAVQYVKPKEGAYVQELLGPLVREIVADEHLDLDCDAVKIFEAFRRQRDASEGVQRTYTDPISHVEAIRDPETRTEYVHRLQATHAFSKKLVKAITTATQKLPYAIRWIAREMLLSLRRRFPDIPDETAALVLGRFIFLRVIKPAILVPENFGIVTTTIEPRARANLREIANLIDQVTLCQRFEIGTKMEPLNAYVDEDGVVFRNWLIDVADVIDVKEHLGVDEYVDVTVEPLPVTISPTEIYAFHKLLVQELDDLDPTGHDRLRSLLAELGGPPLGADVPTRAKPISLKLVNRAPPAEDPEAASKAEWSRAKRLILAVLRVQPGPDILSSLVAVVEDEHIDKWDQIAQDEAHGLPPLPGQQTYNLNDIKNLPYDEVKYQALLSCQALEQQGVILRADGYQAILNSIAYDIRTKNRRQIQRTKEIGTMRQALDRLREKKTDLEEQIAMYNAHNAQSISNMQTKSKRSSVIPLGKQFWHRRSLQQHGQMPEYGSWVYPAKSLYSRGSLLSIDQFSPTQFDRVEIILSSNEAGVFNVEVVFTPPGHTKTTVDKASVTMHELLQRQRDNTESIRLGLSDFSVNLFIAQLNKKFYKN